MSYGSLTNPFNAASLFVGNMPAGYVGTVASNGSQVNLNVAAATVWTGASLLGVGYRHAELDHYRCGGDLCQRQRGGVPRRGRHRQRGRRRDGQPLGPYRQQLRAGLHLLRRRQHLRQRDAGEGGQPARWRSP